MKRFPVVWKRRITVVDESVEGFLYRNKDRITASISYIGRTLMYWKGREISVTLYAEIIGYARIKNSCVKREQKLRISEDIIVVWKAKRPAPGLWKYSRNMNKRKLDGCWIGRICADLRRLKQPQRYISSYFTSNKGIYLPMKAECLNILEIYCNKIFLSIRFIFLLSKKTLRSGQTMTFLALSFAFWEYCIHL